MTPELEDAICEALYELSGLVTKDRAVFVKLRDMINAEMEDAQARITATLALCDRIEDEARDFEPISADGDVAMGTRIHMMGLVRHVLTGGGDA